MNDTEATVEAGGGSPGPARNEIWPPLPLDAWQDTYQTLHMWTQIVGKVRLALIRRSIIGGRWRSMSRRAV